MRFDIRKHVELAVQIPDIRLYLPSAGALADIGFEGSPNDLVSEADSNNLGCPIVPREVCYIVHQLVDPGQVVICIRR
jgi:hypothetical protein